jgi:putative membrane protein
MSALVLARVRAIPWRQPVVWCVAAWVLTMIALPIARWTWGDDVIPAMTTVSAVFQFGAVAVVLWRAWGARRTVVTLSVVAFLTWGAEWVGSTTGFPFGPYDYTPRLQPQLFGVPLLIPLAWLMMLGPSWAVAQAILRGRVNGVGGRLAFIALSALAMTAWDLYLDPQMVGWGFWVWENPSGYFGIPWSNYFGWLLVSSLVTLAAHPARVPYAPLLTVYGVVWVFQAIGMAVFWGMAGPALFGFVTMGALLGSALWRLAWRSR